MGLEYTILLLFIVFVCVGVLFSLPMLWPPLRRIGQRSAKARKIGIAFCALLAFVSGLAVGKCLAALDPYSTTAYPPSVLRAPSSAAIISELVIRGMIPPPLRGSCYSQDQSVCQWADGAIMGWEYEISMSLKIEGFDSSYVDARSDWNSWRKYLDWSFWCSFISCATGSICTWLFTRRREQDRQINSE